MEKAYNIMIKKYENSYQIKIFKNGIKPSSNKKYKNIIKNLQEYNSNRFTDFEIEDLEAEEIERLEKLKEKRELELELKNIMSEERSLKNSVNRSKSNIYDLAKSNTWLYFLTITLNKEKINRYNYENAIKKIRQWFNNVKKRYDNTMTYLMVAELHKDGAIHFHALVGSEDRERLKKALQLNFSGKFDKKNRRVDNVNRFNLGHTTSTVITDSQKAANYLTKYITKELIVRTKGKKRYFRSNNIKKCEIERVKLSKEELQKYILSQEKKALLDKNSFTKTIDINAPNYENQLTIFNFLGTPPNIIISQLTEYFNEYDIKIV